MTDSRRGLTESASATDALTITVQEGGWAYQVAGGGWMLADNEHADRLEVRFAQNDAGRWEPVELRLDAGRPLDSTMLRRLPVTAMETLANSLWREQLASRLHERPPDPGWRPASLPMGKLWQPEGRTKLKPRPGPKPDWFYKRVAVAYSSRAARSNRPAKEMAEANNVPVTTVHRWVKEARRRGFLPPGQKGRRG